MKYLPNEWHSMLFYIIKCEYAWTSSNLKPLIKEYSSVLRNFDWSTVGIFIPSRAEILLKNTQHISL